MPKWDGYSWVDGDPERVGGWVQTFTGRKFYPLDARPDDLDIRDIAHALSLQCRFSGHCRFHYSVAQHCVLVSQQLESHGPVAALWGLLHDAPEAYLVDLPRPLKHSAGFEVYQEAEARLMRVVCRWAGLPYAMPPVVEEMDAVLLATERRDLLGPDCHWEVPGAQPLLSQILSWYPEAAERAYLQAFQRLAALAVSHG